MASQACKPALHGKTKYDLLEFLNLFYFYLWSTEKQTQGLSHARQSGLPPGSLPAQPDYFKCRHLDVYPVAIHHSWSHYQSLNVPVITHLVEPQVIRKFSLTLEAADAPESFRPWSENTGLRRRLWIYKPVCFGLSCKAVWATFNRQVFKYLITGIDQNKPLNSSYPIAGSSLSVLNSNSFSLHNF